MCVVGGGGGGERMCGVNEITMVYIKQHTIILPQFVESRSLVQIIGLSLILFVCVFWRSKPLRGLSLPSKSVVR